MHGKTIKKTVKLKFQCYQNAW